MHWSSESRSSSFRSNSAAGFLHFPRDRHSATESGPKQGHSWKQHSDVPLHGFNRTVKLVPGEKSKTLKINTGVNWIWSFPFNHKSVIWNPESCWFAAENVNLYFKCVLFNILFVQLLFSDNLLTFAFLISFVFYLGKHFG